MASASQVVHLPLGAGARRVDGDDGAVHHDEDVDPARGLGLAGLEQVVVEEELADTPLAEKEPGALDLDGLGVVGEEVVDLLTTMGIHVVAVLALQVLDRLDVFQAE